MHLGSNYSICIVIFNVDHGIGNIENTSALITEINLNKILQEYPHDAQYLEFSALRTVAEMCIFLCGLGYVCFSSVVVSACGS
jgi:hypothetical protein